MESKRIQWVDYTKAIGILLVLIAHAMDTDNYIHLYAYSFHLPLFFIIGGYTIKKERVFNDSFYKQISKNVKNILVPYFFYTAFIVIIEIVKNIIQHDTSVDSTIGIVKNWIFMRGLKADWFLVSLFFAKIIFIGLYKVLKNEKVVLIVLFAVALIILYTDCVRFYYLRGELVGCLGAFFVAIGFVLKETDFVYKYGKKVVPVSLILVSWTILACYNGNVALNVYNFGRNEIIYLINGILGTMTVVFLCVWLETKVSDIKGLEYIGKKSLIIMVVHMEIMAFVKAGVSKVGIIRGNAFIQTTAVIIITLILSLMVTPIVDYCYSLFKKKVIDRNKLENL